jgi:hypothetical protein
MLDCLIVNYTAKKNERIILWIKNRQIGAAQASRFS